MRRRQLLATLPPAFSLSGCLLRDGDCEDNERTLCEGDRLARVTVDEAYPGEVVVRADCRDERYRVRPGEEFELERAEDEEECMVRIYVDDEQVWSAQLSGYEFLTMTIDADGTVDGGTIAV